MLTLFPAMFAGPLDESIIKRARESGLLDLRVHNLRDYAHDRHRTVDDRPFGGGPGMLLKPEPIFEAVEKLANEKTRVVLLSPAGRPFSQVIARVQQAKPDWVMTLLVGQNQHNYYPQQAAAGLKLPMASTVNWPAPSAWILETSMKGSSSTTPISSMA